MHQLISERVSPVKTRDNDLDPTFGFSQECFQHYRPVSAEKATLMAKQGTEDILYRVWIAAEHAHYYPETKRDVKNTSDYSAFNRERLANDTLPNIRLQALDDALIYI